MYDAVLKLTKSQKVFSFLNHLQKKLHETSEHKVFAIDQGFDRQDSDFVHLIEDRTTMKNLPKTRIFTNISIYFLGWLP